MNKRRVIWITVGIGLLLAVLIILLNNRETPISWRDTYRSEGTQPYDLLLLRSLFDNYESATDLILMQDSFYLPPADHPQASYVFIGRAMYLDDPAFYQLLSFVEAGSTAFISTESLPYNLQLEFEDYTCGDFYYDSIDFYSDTTWMIFHSTTDSSIQVRALEPPWSDLPAARFVYQTRFRPQLYDWTFLPEGAPCEESGVHFLSSIGPSQMNYFEIPYGEGRFLIHTNPLLFTNFFVRERTGKAYAEQVFSYLPAGAVYWDDHSRLSAAPPDSQAGPRLSSNHAMQYILEQPPLAWAWYLLLGLFLLYLLFRAKRRQRVIPVVTPRRNTSKAYVQAIGRLYQVQGDHHRLAQQEIRLFRQYLLERFNLPLSLDQADFNRALSTRSGVAPEIVDRLLTEIRFVRGVKLLEESSLLRFHRALQDFYQSASVSSPS